jgi:hypothetical protein
MSTFTAWSLIALASGSVVVAAAAGVAGQGVQYENGAGSEMQTGVTIAPTTATGVPVTERATPSITGPAPLPPEDHGLPG